MEKRKEYRIREPEESRKPLLKEVGQFLMFELGICKRDAPMTRKEVILGIAISDFERDTADTPEEVVKWTNRNRELRGQAGSLSLEEQQFIYNKAKEITDDFNANKRGGPSEEDEVPEHGIN